MLDCENAVVVHRTSAVDYLLSGFVRYVFWMINKVARKY